MKSDRHIHAMPRTFSALHYALLLMSLFMHSGVWMRAAEPAPLTQVRFTAWETDQHGLYLAAGNQTYAPIIAPAYAFGPPAALPAGAPLRICQRIDRPDGPVYEIIAEASLPATCRDAVAYLVRQADKGPLRSYLIVAMSNDSLAFAPGHVRVFNFSPYPATIKIGTTSSGLAPLEWRVFPAQPDRKHRVLVLASLDIPSGGWTAPVRDMLTLRDNYRGTVTLMHTRRSFDPDDPAPLRNSPRVITRCETEYLHPSPIAGSDKNR